MGALSQAQTLPSPRTTEAGEVACFIVGGFASTEIARAVIPLLRERRAPGERTLLSCSPVLDSVSPLRSCGRSCSRSQDDVGRERDHGDEVGVRVCHQSGTVLLEDLCAQGAEHE